MDGAKEFSTSIDTEKNHQGSKISVSNSAVDKSFGNDKSSENLVNLHELASGNIKPLEKKRVVGQT